MSINYCTLASSTVDSFCDPRRNLIFSQLVQILHPPGAGAGIPHRAKFIHRRPPEKWEPPQLPTELERVVVEARFQELSGRDEQEIRPGYDLVTITDLNVEPTLVDVNISNLSFTHAEPSKH